MPEDPPNDLPDRKDTVLNIGPLELMIILLLALVVVGPSRLPEVGRSIGRALREFRKVQDEVRDSINFNLDAEPATPRPAVKPGPPPAAVERARAAAASGETHASPPSPGEDPTDPAPSDAPPSEPAGPQQTADPPTADEAARPAPSTGSPNGSTPAPEPPPE